MKKVNKKAGIIVLMIFFAFFAVLIGPIDYFRHGYYYEEYDFSQIPKEDWKDQISLENQDYEMEFSPIKDNLDGFSIFLYNQPEDNEGFLTISVIDEKGKVIDTTDVDLSKPQAGTWYKTTISRMLKKDRVYKIKFSAKKCKYFPCLQNVGDDYLPDETVSGSILISYAYAQPTFNFQERVMIEIVIIALELLLLAILINQKKRILNLSALAMMLTVLLSWNYMHNSMDNANTMFDGFQIDSEALVTNVIYAEQDGEYFRNDWEVGYGLGYYKTLKGGYINDDNCTMGYSRKEPVLIVPLNDYTKEVAVEGNIVSFSNGEEISIIGVEEDGSNIEMYLNYDSNLIPLKFGNLDDICFFDSNHNELNKGILVAYCSQYGLQGKIFRHLARHMEEDEIINNLHLICCISTAFIFVLIVLIVAIKYNILMAGCFFFTFWLSPWIICFARNLYWVEFTWFIPMLIGLFCLWKINDRKCRIFSYVAAFVFVCFKSLCGYEYISVVMMGLVAFLLVETVISMAEKNREKFKLLVRTVFFLGILALAGFMVAIVIHSKLEGNGDIIEGIKVIIERDVLRRTNTSDLNEFAAVYWPSLNASIWETYSKYFKFGTEIITGITGNMFPLLCIIPLCIFAIDYKNKKLNFKLPTMYFVFFLTSISWFCLAKGHSYIHTHMNYVLWYFGFVQICFYTIVEKIVSLFKKDGGTDK